MKRERSESIPATEDQSYSDSGSNAPQTPPPKPVKAESKPSPAKKTPNNSPRKSKGNTTENGVWTDEIRVGIMNSIIDAGYKTSNLESLAQQHGLSLKQLYNQFTKSRKGTMREKALKAMCTDQPAA